MAEGAAAARRGRIPKKLANLGFGRRATSVQKTRVVQKLRQKRTLKRLLSIAQLPHATFYYHLKKMERADKYEKEKAENTAIFHENRRRYGYRRITMVPRSVGICLNSKTVERLMKELDLIRRVWMKKCRSCKGEVERLRRIC